MLQSRASWMRSLIAQISDWSSVVNFARKRSLPGFCPLTGRHCIRTHRRSMISANMHGSREAMFETGRSTTSSQIRALWVKIRVSCMLGSIRRIDDLLYCLFSWGEHIVAHSTGQRAGHRAGIPATWSDVPSHDTRTLEFGPDTGTDSVEGTGSIDLIIP